MTRTGLGEEHGRRGQLEDAVGALHAAHRLPEPPRRRLVLVAEQQHHAGPGRDLLVDEPVLRGLRPCGEGEQQGVGALVVAAEPELELGLDQPVEHVEDHRAALADELAPARESAAGLRGPAEVDHQLRLDHGVEPHGRPVVEAASLVQLERLLQPAHRAQRPDPPRRGDRGRPRGRRRLGDLAQPLHTTVHHNGWSGPNPHGYTTWSGIHGWIDGGFIAKAGIGLAELRPQVKIAVAIPLEPRADRRDPMFVAVMRYLEAQHAQVEPLYALEKAGKFNHDDTPPSPEGRAFIDGQLLRGGEMLAAIWVTAWRNAAPDTYLRAQLEKRRAGPPAR